jgi:hypothetical protein
MMVLHIFRSIFGGESLDSVRVARQDKSCIVITRAEQRVMDKIRHELGT